MTPERLQQIEELYHSARECAPAERKKLLASADPELRREVESLLDQHRDGALPDCPAADLLGESSVTGLASGEKLGRYQIEAPIGAGGMGQVYRARDTQLGRTVALKVSAREFSDRFEREARAISALNHPHVCTLYDVGPNYLVMEFVEGETLAARLKRGRIKFEEVLLYGAQIAESLAEAHAKGITHRDLKPRNIMITKSGVKVLDFGLAKVEGEGASQGDAILGTPAYMAPEQLEGKGADARSDIYALGLMLREMATGKREAGAELTPPQFAHIVERCLTPDPANRWQSASDIKAELEWAAKARAAAGGAPGQRWRMAASAVLAVALVVAVLDAFRGVRQAANESVAYRLEIQPPEKGHFLVAGVDGGVAVSPDGRFIAYAAEQRGKTGLWIRPLGDVAAKQIPESERASYPFWSPDSRSLGFFVGSKLLRFDLDRSSPLFLCDTPGPPIGGTWMEDGRTIVFSATGSGLWQVPASGAVPAPLLQLNVAGGNPNIFWPQAFPGGRLLYSASDPKRREDADVFVSSFTGGAQRTQAIAPNSLARYVTSGGKHYLLRIRGTALVAQEIDLATLKLSEARVVADQVGDLGALGGMNVAASASGVLAYEGMSAIAQNRLTWVDRSGHPGEDVGEPGTFGTFRISPDGARVAVTRVGGTAGMDLWLEEVVRNAAQRFTANPGMSWFPAWSPDSRTIVFAKSPEHLFSKPSSGVGTERMLTQPGELQASHDWSRDGRRILYFKFSAETQHDLWYLPVTPDGKPAGDPKPYLRSPFNEWFARFYPQPDPGWVAYESDESGQPEVYVQSFPEPRGARRLSTAGGRYPAWNPNGRELFYVSLENKLMAVDMRVMRDTVEPGRPHALFAIPGSNARLQPPFDVAPDGRRFLVRFPVRETPEALQVIVNWPALLK